MATNAQRRAQTRGCLINAARHLFAEQGYADTSTETILSGAGVTRGAMYHHFHNKAELFEAVCDLLSREAMAAIEKAVAGQRGSLATLKAGSLAWVDFMARDDVRRILVVEAPSVLGQERWRALDERYSFPLLREGIREAMEEGALHFSGSAEGLAVLLNGAMNALVLNDPWAENLPRLRQDLLALFDCVSGETP